MRKLLQAPELQLRALVGIDPASDGLARARVAEYVPGYRLKSPPVFEQGPYATPGGPVPARVAVLLEVEGAGDYLPPFAGNLDIMTAAAVRVGAALAEARAGAGV